MDDFHRFNIPIYSSTNFSQFAQENLINDLLSEDFFKNPSVQRQLASYPCVHENEKDKIILNLMNYYWNMPTANDFFMIFRDFDAVFSILGKKGHFIHQFEVFLLGHFLIQKLLQSKNSSYLLELFENKERLHYAWLLTATAHDFGYPLELSNKLAGKFSSLYGKLKFKTISEQYKAITYKFNIETEKELLTIKVLDASTNKIVTINIDEFIHNGIKSSLDLETHEVDTVINKLKKESIHGYISSFILCNSYLEYLSKANLYGKTCDKWRIDILQMVAAAIAIHTLKEDVYIKRISFKNNPLAHLLFLVDNLQEWNRTLRPHDKFASYNLLKFDFNQANSTISLDYILTHEKWTASILADAQASLADKKNLLSWLKPPTPMFNVNIVMNFSTSDGKPFEYPVTISL